MGSKPVARCRCLGRDEAAASLGKLLWLAYSW